MAKVNVKNFLRAIRHQKDRKKWPCKDAGWSRSRLKKKADETAKAWLRWCVLPVLPNPINSRSSQFLPSGLHWRHSQSVHLVTLLLSVLLAMDQIGSGLCLRCYVCGGTTGRPCGEIYQRRRSPYVRPQPLLTADGEKQWEECNDLINNKGCIKQVVNDVVLLRACWMQGTPQCLEDGDATVCTCKGDLCNSAHVSSLLLAHKGCTTTTLIIIIIATLHYLQRHIHSL